MISINAFVGRDVLATLSESVITTQDSINSDGSDYSIHIVVLGVSDGWIRFRFVADSPENQIVPEIVDTPSSQICLPLSVFTRFELI